MKNIAVLATVFVTLFLAPFLSRSVMAQSRSDTELKNHEMAFGPDLQTVTLENGLDVIVISDHRLPIVHVGMSVKTGAVSESPETNGLAHLYEHMFFTANEVYPTSTAFENRERELGIVSNAFTSEEAVVYYFSLPSENLEPGVEFMADAMRRPLFKKEELKQERNVVLDEFNTRTSRPPRRLSRAVDKALFYKYPWRRSTLGERNVIEGATREDMMQFKDSFYRPGNSSLLVIGDVSPDEATRVVRGHFSDWETGSAPSRERPEHPELEESKGVVIGADVEYAMLRTKQFGPPVNENPEATYAADVWGTLLSLSSSRFQKNLVDEGPFENASLSYYTQQDGPSISFRGTFAPGKRKAALRAFHREVRNMAKPGYFTKKQLQAARTRLIVQRKSAVENGRDYLQSLGFWWSVAGLGYYKDYLKQLHNVTLEEIRSFCKTHVQDRPRAYGLLVPSKRKSSENLTPSDLLNEVQSAQDETYSFSPDPLDKDQLTVDPSLTDQSFDLPEKEETTLFHLSNGIPVIHRPVTENDVLSLQLFFDGGTLNYRDRPAGIEKFLLKTMLRGSEAYPLDRLQSVTDRQGISLSSSANYDFSRISVGGLTEDLPLVLDLLTDLVKNPILDAEQVDWVRGQMVNSVKRRRANPRRQVWYVVNRLMFQNHPYRSLPEGTLESLKKIDREQLLSYHNRMTGSGRMLISVVGRLPTDVLKKRLNQTIGTIEERDFDRPEVPPFESGEKRLTTVSRKGLSTAFIAAKIPVPSMTSSDFAPLKLGLEVLSNRIFEETRTKRGLTYGAYAGMPYYRRNWGYLFLTTPRPNLAMSLIHREIQEIKKNDVEEAELSRTANVLYTNQLLKRQTASSIAELLGRYELVGSGWEHLGEVLNRIRSLNPKDVRQVMQTYLKNFYFGAIQGPEMEQKIQPDLYLNPDRAQKYLEDRLEKTD